MVAGWLANGLLAWRVPGGFLAGSWWVAGWFRVWGLGLVAGYWRVAGGLLAAGWLLAGA